MGGTITTDRYVRLGYLNIGETFTIAKNVLVYGDSNDAVHSNLNNSTLINNGNIYAKVGADTGVEFDGSFGNILNNAGALIKAPYGIYFGGTSDTLTNHGTIIGFDDAAVWFGSGSDQQTATNTGLIAGSVYGIHITSFHSGGTIHNSGVIESTGPGSYAIYVNSDFSLTTPIDNKAHGLTIRRAPSGCSPRSAMPPSSEDSVKIPNSRPKMSPLLFSMMWLVSPLRVIPANSRPLMLP
jgi:hypothetical protein